MYTDRQPAQDSRPGKKIRDQKQIDNLVAVGLLAPDQRSNVKKKRNVEFRETGTIH